MKDHIPHDQTNTMSLGAFRICFRKSYGNLKPTYCIWRYLNSAAGEAVSSTTTEGLHKADLFSNETRTNASPFRYKSFKAWSTNKRFRTEENDTAKHTDRHKGLFYTIRKEDYQTLFPPLIRNDLPFRKQVTTFQEACLMVREPAIEVIGLINSCINYELPAPKIVLYGKEGTGKTYSLFHIMHHCFQQKWFIVHIPWAHNWIAHHKDWAASSFKTGRINIPEDAKKWLQQFKGTNSHLIENLTTNFTYTWTQRDTTEAGAPFRELIDNGINRVKYADDVVGAIFKELRHLTSTDGAKVLIAVDGINSFWETFQIHAGRGERTTFPAKKMSLIHHILKNIQIGMKNSVTVCTVDPNLVRFEDRHKYTPVSLLGKQGFEDLEPFIPVKVKNYSEQEIYSQLYYYIDRKWITNEKAKTEDGLKELIALSCYNPLELARLCASC